MYGGVIDFSVIHFGIFTLLHVMCTPNHMLLQHLAIKRQIAFCINHTIIIIAVIDACRLTRITVDHALAQRRQQQFSRFDRYASIAFRQPYFCQCRRNIGRQCFKQRVKLLFQIIIGLRRHHCIDDRPLLLIFQRKPPGRHSRHHGAGSRISLQTGPAQFVQIKFHPFDTGDFLNFAPA